MRESREARRAVAVRGRSRADRVEVSLAVDADTYGYMFLKDLHRLERMTVAGSHAQLADRRFAVFAIRSAKRGAPCGPCCAGYPARVRRRNSLDIFVQSYQSVSP